MRGTKTSTAVWTQVVTTYQAGSSSTRTSKLGIVIDETTIDTRPDDIIRNARDRTGWRNPSGYSREVTRKKEWLGVDTTTRRQPGLITVTHNINNRPPSGVRPLTLPWPEVSLNMLHEAEIKALAKLNSAKTNYAVAFAEASKSVTMIGDNLQSLGRAVRAVRRGRLKDACYALRVTPPRKGWRSKEASGRWLELQYGWLPLVSDIYGAYEDINTGVLPILSATSVVKRPFTAESYFDTISQTTVTLNPSGHYGWKVRLDYAADFPAIDIATKMGLTNPAVIAWELMPWSFLVDWLVPIGPWLEALSAPMGLGFKGGSRTWFAKGAIEGSAEQRIKYNAQVETVGYWSSKHDTSRMNRIVYPGTPVPIPYVRNPLSGKRALNALALLRSSFK